MADLGPLGVVGAGLMGSEIAYLGAAAGAQVRLHDVDDAAVQAGLARAAGIAERRTAKGRMTEEEAGAIVERLRPASGIAGLGKCVVVIEAVSEQMDVKSAVFWDLDRAVAKDALIASNTSGLSITDLGRITRRPERVVGMHFFNPASVMPLVEVIEGDDTSAATMDDAVALASALGKTPVRVRECPGFLVNRVLVRAMVSAYRVAEDHHAAPGAVDAAVVARGPAPMGPFALGDLVGLDTLLSISQYLEQAFGDTFAPGRRLSGLVADGALGAKTGRGFDPDADAPIDGPAELAATAYYDAALTEARACDSEAIAATSDIDLAMRLGAGWEVGPLEALGGAS